MPYKEISKYLLNAPASKKGGKVKAFFNVSE